MPTLIFDCACTPTVATHSAPATSAAASVLRRCFMHSSLDVRAHLARDEIGRRARQGLRLIAVRRMAAVVEDDGFRVRQALANACDLRERSVLVVAALDHEHGACD